MTEGSEWKLILLFTLPLMAGNFLQQLYNAVDGIVVGNFAAAGENALAAVGTCAPITMLFIAVAMGMSTGCSILIAQLHGARQYDEMRKAVATSLILVIAVGLVLSVVGSVVAQWLLTHVLKVSEDILADATAYFAIYCFGLVFQFAYNIVSFILRSLGDSAATLYFLLVSSVTNIVLDLVFVICLHWDVPGVAIATVIAQALSAVVSVIYMFKRYPILRFAKGEFRFHRKQAAQALRLSIRHHSPAVHCVLWSHRDPAHRQRLRPHRRIYRWDADGKLHHDPYFLLQRGDCHLYRAECGCRPAGPGATGFPGYPDYGISSVCRSGGAGLYAGQPAGRAIRCGRGAPRPSRRNICGFIVALSASILLLHHHKRRCSRGRVT